AGTAVGVLSTDDPDAGDVVTFSLLSQADKFVLGSDGRTLAVKSGAVLDYEATPSLAVTAQPADTDGHTVRRTATVHLTDVTVAPTAVYLGGAPRPSPTRRSSGLAGTAVGVLSTDDPDAGDVVTFSLLSQADKFALAADGRTLAVKSGAVLDYEAT